MIDELHQHHLVLYQYCDYLRRRAVLNNIVNQSFLEFISLILLIRYFISLWKSLVITFRGRYVKILVVGRYLSLPSLKMNCLSGNLVKADCKMTFYQLLRNNGFVDLKLIIIQQFHCLHTTRLAPVGCLSSRSQVL